MVGLESLRRMLGRRLLRWADALLQAGGGAPAPHGAARQPDAQADAQPPAAAPTARELWEARVAAWAAQPGHAGPADDAATESHPDAQAAPVPRPAVPVVDAPAEALPAPGCPRPAPPVAVPPARVQRPAPAPAAEPAHAGLPQADARPQVPAPAPAGWHLPGAPRTTPAGNGFHARAGAAIGHEAPGPMRSRLPPLTQARPATPFGQAATRPPAPEPAPRATARPAAPRLASATHRGDAAWHTSAHGAARPALDYPCPAPQPAPALRVVASPVKRAARTDAADAPGTHTARVLHLPHHATPSPQARPAAQPPATPQTAFDRPARATPASSPAGALPAPAQAATAWPDLPAWPPTPGLDQPAAAGSAAQRLQRLEREHGG